MSENKSFHYLQPLWTFLQIRQPFILMGGPGSGKNDGLEWSCEALRIKYFPRPCHTILPEDWEMPVRTENSVIHIPLPLFTELARLDQKWCLNLDELPSVDIPKRPPMLNLLLYSRLPVSDFNVDPKGIGVIVALGNPEDQAENGAPLSAAMSNRLAHLWMEGDDKDWAMQVLRAKGAKKWLPPDKGQFMLVPDNWEKHIPQASALVANYALARYPAKVIQDPPEDTAKLAEAWPSRRTWVMCYRAIAACLAMGLTATSELALTLGRALVGDAIVEFSRFVDTLDLKPMEEYLKNPMLIEADTRQDTLYAIATGVTMLVKQEFSTAKWKKLWGVLGRIAAIGNTDIAAVVLGDVMKMKPKDAVIPSDAQVFIPVLQTAGLL